MQETESLKADWARTSLGWQERNLMIVDKASKLIPLRHKKAQLILFNAKQRQRKRGFPVRIIVVKARQKGLSTAEAAERFEDVNRNPNRHMCLISLDLDGTDKVFRMSKTFQDNMPADSKRRTVASNRKAIIYTKPHNSSILCQTAGKDVGKLGRGGTTHGLHATEVAFWRHAESQLAGLLQEVPKTPDSSVVIESTAFGTVGAFHDRYTSAVDRVRLGHYDGFIPVFVPWFVDDEYQMAIPRRRTMNLETDHENYGDEQQLFRKHGLTPEQLYWRRWMIDNDFNGDLSWFKQEYPSTWREAFQGTGRMVFRPGDLDAMEEHCKPPIATIEFFEEGGTVRYRNVNRRANCWSVWQWPIKHRSYAGFADVAEGMLSDTTNPKSTPDRSVAGFMDRDKQSLVITYYGRPDTIEFGDQFVMACKFYNYAWASPEMNSIGQSVLDTMKRAEYQYIYSREHHQEQDVEEDSKKLGWKTTVLTRKPLVADLQKVVKDHLLVVQDVRVIDELRTFVWNATGKAEADKGEHDDCVIMLGGLLQMHRRCPLNEDLSWADETETVVPELAMMGAVAPLDPEDEHELNLLYEQSVLED